MIKQTIYAVADNDSRPIHTGTLFELKKNQINLVSVDGYRWLIEKNPFKMIWKLVLLFRENIVRNSKIIER